MRRKVRHGGTLGRGRWLLGKKRTTNHRQTRTGADAREVESIDDISMGGALLLGAAGGFALLHVVLGLRAFRDRRGGAGEGRAERGEGCGEEGRRKRGKETEKRGES